MEIAESVPPSKVTINLDFVKPFEAHNIVEFTLEPKGDATNVTWTMQGPTPYFAKIIHVFMQHGQHGRQGLRDRPRQSEGRR